MTYNVTAEYASQNFEEVIQRANLEAEGVTIVKNNKSFVLIDREELEALIETAELLEVPGLVSDIAEARTEYEKGETLEMIEELGIIAIAEFDAETRFRAMATKGNPEEGIAILNKLDACFADPEK